MSRVVFLGGGRITSAMLAGLRLAKHDYRLLVHDRNPGKLRDLKKRYAVEVEADLKRAVTQADILIVAVRPGSIRELLREIAHLIPNATAKFSKKTTTKSKRRLSKLPLSSRGPLAISVVAGVPLRVLSKVVSPPMNWARAMPSPLCRSGRGLTALTFPKRLARGERKRVYDLFASFGKVVEIPERRFDAFTVTYSCSYGYHLLASLADAAQAIGLDRHTALLASAHALADGIVAWREGTESLESLIEEAVTPGGIAAATIAAADAAGCKRAVRRGVAAGLRRARNNAGK
jgi:pyrroline-5-carboxylate reductase